MALDFTFCPDQKVIMELLGFFCFKLFIFAGIKKGRYTFEIKSRLKKDLDKLKKNQVPSSSRDSTRKPPDNTLRITQDIPNQLDKIQEQFTLEKVGDNFVAPVPVETFQNVQLMDQNQSNPVPSSIPEDQHQGNVSI